jgi:ankyrin repeat protein
MKHFFARPSQSASAHAEQPTAARFLTRALPLYSAFHRSRDSMDWTAILTAPYPIHEMIVSAESDGDLSELKAVIAEHTTGAGEVDSTDDNGYTPLMYAAYLGRNNTIRMLVEDYSADVSRPTVADGMQCIHLAAMNNHMETVQLLLEHGASPEAQDGMGNTALHYAAWHGFTDMVEMLISAGSSVDPRDKDGMTPLIKASIKGNGEIVKLLLAHGANVNAITRFFQSSLYWACRCRHFPIVNLLLTSGANPDIQIKVRQCPLPRPMSSLCP